jgi:hypothetical protein
MDTVRKGVAPIPSGNRSAFLDIYPGRGYVGGLGSFKDGMHGYWVFGHSAVTAPYTTRPVAVVGALESSLARSPIVGATHMFPAKGLGYQIDFTKSPRYDFFGLRLTIPRLP